MGRLTFAIHHLPTAKDMNIYYAAPEKTQHFKHNGSGNSRVTYGFWGCCLTSLKNGDGRGKYISNILKP